MEEQDFSLCFGSPQIVKVLRFFVTLPGFEGMGCSLRSTSALRMLRKMLAIPGRGPCFCTVEHPSRAVVISASRLRSRFIELVILVCVRVELACPWRGTLAGIFLRVTADAEK